MLGRIVQLACLVALAGCTPVDRSAQDFLCPTETPATLRREKAINAELAGELAPDGMTLLRSDHPRADQTWAGRYSSRGGYVSSRYVIAPHSGALYRFASCQTNEVNDGDITRWTSDGVTVSWKRRAPERPYSENLFFVRWGERRYLVPENELVPLINGYNQFGSGAADSEPFFLACHEGDRSKPATGRPRVPTKWASLFREEPIRATIAYMSSTVESLSPRDSSNKLTLQLNAGSRDGLYKGLELRDSYPGTRLWVTITEVTETEAVGTTTEFANGQSLKVGDVLTNRPE